MDQLLRWSKRTGSLQTKCLGSIKLCINQARCSILTFFTWYCINIRFGVYRVHVQLTRWVGWSVFPSERHEIWIAFDGERSISPFAAVTLLAVAIVMKISVFTAFRSIISGLPTVVDAQQQRVIHEVKFGEESNVRRQRFVELLLGVETDRDPPTLLHEIIVFERRQWLVQLFVRGFAVDRRAFQIKFPGNGRICRFNVFVRIRIPNLCPKFYPSRVLLNLTRNPILTGELWDVSWRRFSWWRNNTERRRQSAGTCPDTGAATSIRASRPRRDDNASGRNASVRLLHSLMTWWWNIYRMCDKTWLPTRMLITVQLKSF